MTAYRKKQKIFRYRAPCERCFSKLQMQQKLELVSKDADRYADREAEAAAEAAAAPALQIRKVEQGATAPAAGIAAAAEATAAAPALQIRKVTPAEAADAAAAFLTVAQFVNACKNCRSNVHFTSNFLESELECRESDTQMERMCEACLHRCSKWNHGTKEEKTEVYRAAREAEALLNWRMNWKPEWRFVRWGWSGY